MGEGGIGELGFGSSLFVSRQLCVDPFDCPNEARADCDRARAELEMLLATTFAADPAAYARGRLMFGDVSRSDPCQLRPRLEQVAGGNGMSILDSIVGGIGNAIGTAVGTIGQLAQPIIGAVQTVQQVQSVINGSAPVMMSAPPPAMMAAMMAAGGGAVTQGSDAQAAFRAACEMDPACKAAVIAALQGGGGTSMMMNGGSAGSVEAQLAALAGAGLPASLVMALRSAGPAALSTLRSILPGLAIGTAATVGLEALTGALPSGGGGGRLPRRIMVPDGRGGTREYVSRGRPLLYSGDVAAVRRVAAVAKRARASRPRRRLPVAQQMLVTHAPCGRCLTSPCACKS